jgi:nucleotide-binding universal stress UspA family protein
VSTVSAAETHVATHPWLTGKIVAGIDGSVGSLEALRAAARLAQLGGARVELVSAWQAPLVYGIALSAVEWSPRAEAQEALLCAITDVFGESLPDGFSAVMVEGTDAHVLIEASKDADLLVVGSRGHGGFSGLLLGSVSAACVEHAHCPVLVVHSPSSVLLGNPSSEP